MTITTLQNETIALIIKKKNIGQTTNHQIAPDFYIDLGHFPFNMAK